MTCVEPDPETAVVLVETPDCAQCECHGLRRRGFRAPPVALRRLARGTVVDRTSSAPDTVGEGGLDVAGGD